MSLPAVQALDDDLSFDLVYSDGWPLDSNWERIQIDLLIDVARQAMAERGRPDFFAGGDMFVYHSVEQAKTVAQAVAQGRSYQRGPDFFFVEGVKDHDRKSWVSWKEEGRLPDVIVELLSPSTKNNDRTTKKDLYAGIFRTPEYFLYEPATGEFEGFRLVGDRYQRLFPDAGNRFWSEKLGLKLGLWQGLCTGVETTWVRLFEADGRLVPTKTEAADARAEAERKKAEAERKKAEAAEARAEAERKKAEAADARAEAERERAEAERERAEVAEAELARLRAKLEGTSG
ncbi:MAG TPA: Uma2 family endonuclease [Thermoanaerobaculia bacterium]